MLTIGDKFLTNICENVKDSSAVRLLTLWETGKKNN